MRNTGLAIYSNTVPNQITITLLKTRKHNSIMYKLFLKNEHVRSVAEQVRQVQFFNCARQNPAQLFIKTPLGN